MSRKRADSVAIRKARRRSRQARMNLRDQQRAQGLKPPVKPTIANHLSQCKSPQEEQQAREEAVVEKVAIIRAQLPTLLARLAQIPDPRCAKKTKHLLTSLMLYGILCFVLQIASRRQANREVSRPTFKDNLMRLFPELASLAHHDTLMRLLDRIDVEQIQEAHIELVRRLIRKRKFQQLLIEGHYPIAIDGTQKFAGSTLWDEQYLQRQVGDEKHRRQQYYLGVLEAVLAFGNGMRIPLMSEFLDYGKGDSERDKQDCETRAFYRLAKRLHEAFPRLPIMVLLDGMYPTGPTMQLCKQLGWQFMIVLQDDSLPQVWEEYRGLKKLLEPKDRHQMNWGGRRQTFHWTNRIEYDYQEKGNPRRLTVHLVVCEERWQQIDPATEHEVTNSSHHAWLSSRALSQENVHRRCNLAARYRWAIEEEILIEKRCGYHYQHCFSYSWSAMKGYHYLMRIAHLLNVLVQYSSQFAKLVGELGAQGMIGFIRQTLSGPWLDHEQVAQALARPRQLRFAMT